MRAAVYNRYWSTGDGPRSTAPPSSICSHTTSRSTYSVHDPIGLDWLGDRLQVDLAQVKVRELDDRSGPLRGERRP